MTMASWPSSVAGRFLVASAALSSLLLQSSSSVVLATDAEIVNIAKHGADDPHSSWLRRNLAMNSHEDDDDDDDKKGDGTCGCSHDAFLDLQAAHDKVWDQVPLMMMGLIEKNKKILLPKIDDKDWHPKEDYELAVEAVKDVKEAALKVLDCIDCGSCHPGADDPYDGITHFECCCDAYLIRDIAIERMKDMARMVSLNPLASNFTRIAVESLRDAAKDVIHNIGRIYDCDGTTTTTTTTTRKTTTTTKKPTTTTEKTTTTKKPTTTTTKKPTTTTTTKKTTTTTTTTTDPYCSKAADPENARVLHCYDSIGTLGSFWVQYLTEKGYKHVTTYVDNTYNDNRNMYTRPDCRKALGMTDPNDSSKGYWDLVILEENNVGTTIYPQTADYARANPCVPIVLHDWGSRVMRGFHHNFAVTFKPTRPRYTNYDWVVPVEGEMFDGCGKLKIFNSGWNVYSVGVWAGRSGTEEAYAHKEDESRKDVFSIARNANVMGIGFNSDSVVSGYYNHLYDCYIERILCYECPDDTYYVPLTDDEKYKPPRVINLEDKNVCNRQGLDVDECVDLVNDDV